MCPSPTVTRCAGSLFAGSLVDLIGLENAAQGPLLLVETALLATTKTPKALETFILVNCSTIRSQSDNGKVREVYTPRAVVRPSLHLTVPPAAPVRARDDICSHFHFCRIRGADGRDKILDARTLYSVLR
ncbi:hypothetical protein VTJ04DRAFT_10517 [Mycothermus thermophilus]|uniref:uncharacterized protein n=1 Tax=Humicola insolens TaxID=85995 RepID=UPI0037432567